MANMRALKLSMCSAFACILGMLAAPSLASDNSISSLDVFALLENQGKQSSFPIPNAPLPPPIIIRPKPPSLEQLQAQLAADRLLILNEEQSLYQSQLQLNFWIAQPKDYTTFLDDPNVPLWQQAVESDQNLLNTVQAQINALTAQIAAAQ
jgi:hypothetical protein